MADIPFAFLRLMLAGIAMAAVYVTMLLFVMGQKDLYVELLQGLRRAA